MYCRECGTSNDDNNFRCIQCGAILQVPPPSEFGGAIERSMGEPMPWRASQALSYGWSRIKGDAATILGTLVVVILISGALNAIERNVAMPAFISLALQLGTFVVQCFLTAGTTLFCLKVVRVEQYEIGDIFKGGRWLLPIMGAAILMGIIVGFGFILLIVPGIILGLGLSMTFYCVVDRNEGPIEAMKTSWEITKGFRADIFLFWLLSLFLVLGGLLAFCVGVFVAIPVIQVGWAFAYVSISGQNIAFESQTPLT